MMLDPEEIIIYYIGTMGYMTPFPVYPYPGSEEE
jgi:hypothetical protein